MKSALIWHQNHWKPLSAPPFPRFSQSLGNLNSLPALQVMDVCTHPPGLTKIISWILWLGWVSISHDLRAARGDVCFEMPGKIFHIKGELQPGTSSCHGIIPGRTSSIPSPAHTPCPSLLQPPKRGSHHGNGSFGIKSATFLWECANGGEPHAWNENLGTLMFFSTLRT